MTRTIVGQPNEPVTDGWNLTGTTVVQRLVDGEPQLVIVCGECEVVHTIGVPQAMQAALNDFMKWHREERHPIKTTDALSGVSETHRTTEGK